MFCTDIRLSVLSFNCRPPPPMPANAVAGNNTGRGAVRLHAAAAPMSLGRSVPTVRTFAQLLVNVLLASFINFTIWFAITFFVYLETRSVFATGMIAGIFLVAMAGTGVWFGSIVDHHRKKSVIQASALVSPEPSCTCNASLSRTHCPMPPPQANPNGSTCAGRCESSAESRA